MLSYYAIPAGLVFLIAFGAFWADQTTPKKHLQSWVFITVAALLWPVTLPFILWKKVGIPLRSSFSEDEDEDTLTKEEIAKN